MVHHVVGGPSPAAALPMAPHLEGIPASGAPMRGSIKDLDALDLCRLSAVDGERLRVVAG
jgi:hypothetical protein